MRIPLFLLPALLLASCIGLSDQEEIKLNDYKRNSKNYYNQGKYLQAIDQCRKGLEIDDDDYSLNLELGMALFYHSNQLKARGDRMTYLFAARDQLRRTDNLRWFFSSDDYRVHLGLGMVHYKIATEYRKQLEELDLRMTLEPELAAELETNAETCRLGVQEEIVESQLHLEEVLTYDRQRDNLEAILYLGQTHAYVGDFEESVGYLEYGLTLLDQSNTFYERRLESEERMSARQRSFYEGRVEANKTRERELRGILANTFNRLERQQDRLRQFEILVERGLADGVVYYNKALAEQDLGLHCEAIMDFSVFIRRGVDNESDISDLDVRERLHTSVESMLTLSVKIEEKDEVAHYVAAHPEGEKELRCALAHLYASVGHFEKCVRQYDILQERELMDGDLYYNRALAEQELGRYREAILDYDRFLKEGGISSLQIGFDERFQAATENIQKCQILLDEISSSDVNLR